MLPAIEIDACSAGVEAHGLNPRAVRVMQQHGIELSTQTSKIVTDEMLDQADLVVTVCSHADDHCPTLPGNKQKLHLPFEDPAKAIGTEQEISDCFERVCLQIKHEVGNLLMEIEEGSH